MERGESAGELEGNQKPLGVLSRLAVLAAADWFRAIVFSNDAAFLKAIKKLGANFITGGMFKEFAVRDGRLITGQQQYSGKATAKLVIEALGM